MTQGMTSATAGVIADLAVAWDAFESVGRTLTGPAPDPGALLAARDRLRPLLPGFDPAVGKMVWEVDPDLDLVPDPDPEGGWVDAGVEVVYVLHCLTSPSPLGSFAHLLGALGAAVGDLVSWHPNFDGSLGVIVEDA